MTWFSHLFGHRHEDKEETIPETQEVRNKESEIVASPVTGMVFPLNLANDPVFASGAMGQGIAITPLDQMIYAPFDGEVTISFATGHAFGLRSDKGAEVLIHVGIDTIALNGEGFESFVAQGDRVKLGDPIVRFDKEIIEKADLETTTMVIITNSTDYLSLTTLADETIQHGENLLRLDMEA